MQNVGQIKNQQKGSVGQLRKLLMQNVALIKKLQMASVVLNSLDQPNDTDIFQIVGISSKRKTAWMY